MTQLTFELGFDWCMPPTQKAEVVYPLQISLIREQQVISPANSSAILTGDTLRFCIYDITDPSSAAAGKASPQALQILFASAVAQLGEFFSPIRINGVQQAQLSTLTFQPNAPISVAYGTTSGWNAELATPSTLTDFGRFELRALLTVVNPGQMARFYRVDPEMIVGDGGTGDGTDPG